MNSEPIDNQSDEFVPFPVDCLPGPLCEFVTAGAKAIGCDPAFIALPVLSVCGAAIGNAARIKVKSSWLPPPLIWTAIVGDSGTRKTPAFRLAVKPVRDRQDESLAAHADVEREYQRKLAIHKKALSKWEKEDGNGDPPEKPEEPVIPRCVIGGVTLEALVSLLAGNPRGLLLADDELNNWLSSFGQYKSGAGDSAQWLSTHSAESVTVDRKTATRFISVPNAAVSITGGIQPAIFRKAMVSEHRASGLLARFLLSSPRRTARVWTDDDIDPSIYDRYAGIVNRLYDLPMVIEPDGKAQPNFVELTSESRSAYVEFYNRNGRESAAMTGDLAAAWSKIEEYALRLALVFHLVRVVAGDATLADKGVIDPQTTTAAIRLVEWFKHETKRVYAMLAGAENESTHAKIVDWIKKEGRSVTARELQKGMRGIRDTEEATTILQSLVESGVLKSKDTGRTKLFSLMG